MAADVVDGSEPEAAVRRSFADPAVACLPAHNAKPAGYDCSVERA